MTDAVSSVEDGAVMPQHSAAQTQHCQLLGTRVPSLRTILAVLVLWCSACPLTSEIKAAEVYQRSSISQTQLLQSHGKDCESKMLQFKNANEENSKFFV